MLAIHSYRHPEHSEVVRIAIALATKGAFADAYCDNCGPTAHAAPLYPLLLSGVFRLVGVGARGDLAQEIFSSLLASAQYALLPWVAEACGMSFSAGVLAGALGAFLPINKWIQTKGNFEYALAALLCVIVSGAIFRAWRNKRNSVTEQVRLGILWGLLLLTAPQLAPSMLVTLGYSVLIRPDSRKRALVFAMVQLTLVAACLAPWAIRNWVILDAPIWSRSNLGLELHISNNPDSSATWDETDVSGVLMRMHPYNGGPPLARYLALGEVQFNAEQKDEAMQWMIRHAREFALLTAQRIYYFWICPLKRREQMVALALITIMGFLGLRVFYRTGTHASRYFAILWVIFPLPAYLFMQSGRMRYPIEWTSFLLAAYWLEWMAERYFDRAADC
jgi:hypothetical protein